MHKIELDGESIPYTIIKSKRRRSIGIQVKLEEGLVIRVPNRTSKKYVESALQAKKTWILKNIRIRQTVKDQKQQLLITQGETIRVFGKKLELEVRQNTSAITKIYLTEASIIFECRYDKFTNAKYKRSKLQDFLKTTLEQYLVVRINHYSKKIGRKPHTVIVRTYKRRWGSATTKGKCSFNWKLAMAPKEIIDYVVIHELCHLIHLNHSQKFWSLVRSLYPDYIQVRSWLKDNGPYLDI